MRSQLYSTVGPHQFIVVPLKKPPEKPACANAHTTRIAGRYCKRHLSRDAACSRNRIQPRKTATETTLSRQTSRLALDSDTARTTAQACRLGTAIQHSIDTKKSQSALSLWHLCPAPPVARQRAATALPRLRPDRCMVETMPKPSFYSGPTPRLQHLTRTRPRYAPATKPAAKVLPALVMHFASWVTWLEGVIPQASGRMCGLPPAIVSASWQNAKNGHFRGQNTEATPYPSITAFRRCMGKYGTPKQRFRQRLPRHSPASPYGPLMVELFTAIGFANGPRVRSKPDTTTGSPFDPLHQAARPYEPHAIARPARTRLRLSPAEGSPRRHTFNEPALSVRSEARGRICSQ